MLTNSKIVIDVKDIDKSPILDTGLSLIIENITSQEDFSKAYDFIKRFYEENIYVTLYSNNNKIQKKLSQINYDSQIIAFFIEGDMNFNKKRYCFGDLIRIIQKLTSEDGCPWDKEQTHESIRPNMIEEAYEAVDAVNRNDKEGIMEELGDVMLQTVLNADIAKRNNDFTIEDVISHLCHKLYFRHTHIFGNNKADNALDALSNWEKAKAEEKNYSTTADQIAKLPQNLPALLYCQKALKKLFSSNIINLEDFEKLLKDLALGDYEQKLGSNFISLCAQSLKMNLDAEVILSKTMHQLIKNIYD